VALEGSKVAALQHGLCGHKLAFIQMISSSILHYKMCYLEWTLRNLHNYIPTLSATLILKQHFRLLFIRNNSWISTAQR